MKQLQYTLLFIGLCFMAYMSDLIGRGTMYVLIALAMVIFLGTLWYFRIYLRGKIKRYGRRLENIYEWQRKIDDKEVILRADKHRHWLQLSGNQMGVQVVTIIFQDSHNPSETWEEYLDRVSATIANDRTLRHMEIEASQGREYYLREMHGQKGIRLPEEELSNSSWSRFSKFFSSKKSAV